MMKPNEIVAMCRVDDPKSFQLKNHDPEWAGDANIPKDDRKKFAKEVLSQNVSDLAEAQERLYASNTWSLLILFQAMDAAGKDSTIKHVMSGINPQGCQVFSFKQPSVEELDHNYLWRYTKCHAGAGSDRDLQPVVLRGSPRRPRPPASAPGRAHPRVENRRRLLERPLRGHQRPGASPVAQRHPHPQVLPERLQERAAQAVPQAAGRSHETLEILGRRPRRASPDGTTT